MNLKLGVCFLLLLGSLGCSVYKSQGRKSFETDTPARVPIALSFQCRSARSAQEKTRTVDIAQLKQIPGLTVRPAFSQETVVLLVSSPDSDQFCFSESLDLGYYRANQDIFASQLNTWP